MKYSNAIKTLERNGFSVVRDVRDSVVRPGEKYESGLTATKAGSLYRIEVTKNGGLDDDEVSTIRTVRHNDHDDLLTDYFAGSYWRTLKHALESAEATREPQTAAQRVREEIKSLFVRS